MGLGLGMSLALSINLVPHVFEPRDAGKYSITIFIENHALTADVSHWNGRCAAVSMAGRIDRSLNLRQHHQSPNHVAAPIDTVPEQLSELSKYAHVLDNLPPAAVGLVRQAYAIGFRRSVLALNGFAGAALLATFLLWGQPAYGSR